MLLHSHQLFAKTRLWYINNGVSQLILIRFQNELQICNENNGTTLCFILQQIIVLVFPKNYSTVKIPVWYKQNIGVYPKKNNILLQNVNVFLVLTSPFIKECYISVDCVCMFVLLQHSPDGGTTENRTDLMAKCVRLWMLFSRLMRKCETNEICYRC